jgi:glycosyltransferase involved in cell wall biosynthesis
MSLRLTVGMPSFHNRSEVWATVEALRNYHDLTDCEILVVDNFGDDGLEKYIKAQGAGVVRYEKILGNIGPSGAKNAVFSLAKAEMVICIDSHIFFPYKGALDIPVTEDLLYGPLMYNDHKNYVCEWLPVWRGENWGIWGGSLTLDKIPKEPFSIWGNGGGCFATKRSSWLGFNPKCKGFGGAEEGILPEKYRKAGRRVLCQPSMIWQHFFEREVVPYPVNLIDRVRNYVLNFNELSLDKTEMIKHFGEPIIKQAEQLIAKENEMDIAKTNEVSAPTIIVNSNKLISCLTLTYGRPHVLEEAVESFLRQDYQNKELIILNDMPEQEIIFNHPQVKVFNLKERFKTLGDKRNKSVELASGDILTSWDDDDISLPWRVSQIAKAFEDNSEIGFFKPQMAWCYYGNELKKPHTNMFFMMAAYTRQVYNEVGGYQSINVGDDTNFFSRVMKHLGPKAKIVSFPENEYAFIYGWRGNSVVHLSALGRGLDNGASNLEKAEKMIKAKPVEPVVELKPHWNEDYLQKTREILKQ